jgi:hypothetical protein
MRGCGSKCETKTHGTSNRQLGPRMLIKHGQLCAFSGWVLVSDTPKEEPHELRVVARERRSNTQTDNIH